MIPYTLVRSNRKTIAIHIHANAAVEVRAPRKLPQAEIDKFIMQKDAWIQKNIGKALARKENALLLTKELELKLKERAQTIIPERVSLYAKIMGVTPASIKINSAKKNLGSCNNKHMLNFSWRIMLTDMSVIDYLVVHELAHIREFNHSKNFWAVVESVLPDYKDRRKKLREMPIIR